MRSLRLVVLAAVVTLLLAAPAQAAISFSSTSYSAGSNGGFVTNVTVGDFNADGHPDVVAPAENSDPGKISVFLGSASGALGTASVIDDGGSAAGRAAVGDFNGDGKLDIAVANRAGSNNVLSVLLGNGNGTFATPATYAAPVDSRGITVGDFNKDGHPDIAIGNGNGGTGSVSVFLNTGTGTFAPRTDYPTNTSGRPTFAVATADFNGDGNLDLVASDADNSTSYVTLFAGSAAGTFTKVAEFSAGDNRSGQTQGLTVGDFNKDGRPDVATANFEGDAQGNSTTVLLNTGNGGASTFGTATAYSLGTGPFDVASGDFDLDGNPDLTVAVDNDSYVAVLRGDGAGAFGAGQYAGASSYTRGVAVADFNGDGRLDIASAAAGTNAVQILLNTTVVPPFARTDPETAVGQNAATLHGTVNPRGRDTHYYFEYGTSDSYGSRVPLADADAGTGTTEVPVSANLAGLSPGTIYHYRIVATAGTDTVTGADQSFTTTAPAPPPPAATTDPATAGSTSATLHGRVDPNGRDTHYYFEYGSSASYGSRSTLADGDAGAGNAEVPVTSTLTGLLPGRTYHYRLTARAGTDTVHGGDRTFTTSAEPPACRDQTAPFSRFDARRSRVSRAGFSLRGRSTDRGCPDSRVVSVQISIARQVRGRCLPLHANGRFGRPQSCRVPFYGFRARGTARWSLSRGLRLPPGLYRAFAKATDASGNRERIDRRRRNGWQARVR